MAEPDFISTVLSGSSSTQLQSSTQAATSLTSVRRLVLDHGAEAVARDLQQQVHNTTPTACKVRHTMAAVCETHHYSSTQTITAGSCSTQILLFKLLFLRCRLSRQFCLHCAHQQSATQLLQQMQQPVRRCAATSVANCQAGCTAYQQTSSSLQQS
jgi:hypothetical protein